MRVYERLMRVLISSNNHAVDGEDEIWSLHQPVLCEIVWNMGHSACELVGSRFLNPTVLYALAAIQLQSIRLYTLLFSNCIGVSEFSVESITLQHGSCLG